MTRRNWVRLDNASNVFLAAMSTSDSKVFRLSAELDVEVDPGLLQQALDVVFDQYVLYHAVLRQGVFWYYLEDSDLRPVVSPDVLPPCDHIYHSGHRELLFRVIHHRNRIILEVLHALSDGFGAFQMFRDLVSVYVALRHPSDFPDLLVSTGVKQPLAADSFREYFHPKPFAEAARPAPLDAGERTPQALESVRQRNPIFTRPRLRGRERVHRVRGTRTPDNRTRVIELEMSARAVLSLARADGVSLTVYLTALFLEAIRRVDTEPEQPARVAVSVPVELRRRFPSDSARNFFATTRLEYNFGAGEEGPGGLARSLNEQLLAQTTPAALEAKLAKLIGFELNPVIRVIPRPLKDFILGSVNRINNRSLTVAMSNLGNIDFPERINQYVGAVFLQVSAARPQFCMVSHGDRLTISFTSPFIETVHQQAFVRSLTQQGVHVVVAASRVTADELEGRR